jgi:hypothetical protein
MRPNYRRLIAHAASALAMLCMTAAALPERGTARELLLVEPVHHVGFLPIYVARHIHHDLAGLAAGRADHPPR